MQDDSGTMVVHPTKPAATRRKDVPRDFGFLPIPLPCQVDLNVGHKPFGSGKAIVFACVSTFTMYSGWALLVNLVPIVSVQFRTRLIFLHLGQYLLMVVLYLITPDMPAKNPDLSYFQILKTMARFAVTEPVLIQGCLIFFFNSAIFGGFWVTMTFLLGGAPYNYSTLVIGLFGLVGMLGISIAPLVGRLLDGLVPWTAALVAIILVLSSQILQTFTGELNIGAVVITTISSYTSTVIEIVLVFMIAPQARARLNAVLLLSLFMGSVMGTAVGTKLFVERGYKFSSGIRATFGGLELLLLMIRGPHVGRKTWVGWEGGVKLRKPAEPAEEKPTERIATKDVEETELK
ncbi:MFS DHA1 protein [Mycena venus]|uniref:MFS DHA1 protein n=1 Tax=Mycena venus TaxID=2733690 RepID=A0A8H6Z101_9AGAR|nr:MFS DHA1 protein [Mycena venus]